MSSAAFWFVTVAVVLAEGAIVVTALRMRVEPNPARGILGARPAEVLWTLLPMALIALLLLLSYREFESA